MANKPVRKLSRDAHRRQIHRRVRRSVAGTSERPRLCIYRSLGHIYAQIKGGGNIAAAKLVGKIVAERAKAAGIDKVVFDRGGYRYHGRVQALAAAAREAGLNF